MLFMPPDPSLLKAFLAEEIFFAKISEVLFHPTPDIRVVSRISMLLGHLLLFAPEAADLCCGFVIKLLDFAYEPGVFHLFDRICSPTFPSKTIISALVTSHWSQTILFRLETPSENEYQTAALIRAIRIGADHPTLSRMFQTRAVLVSLSKFLIAESAVVHNELWWAVSSVVRRENVGDAVCFVASAIARFEVSDRGVTRSQIFAIELIARMVEFRLLCAAMSIDYEVRGIIVGLGDRFPSSSNLMGAVFRLMRSCLFWEVTIPMTAGMFIPALIVHVGGGMRTAASAWSLLLLTELQEKRATLPALREMIEKIGVFDDFCRQHLGSYVKILRL
jgi:hypothetical protein